MMPCIRLIFFSAAFISVLAAAWAIWAGNLSTKPDNPPILRICVIWLLKSDKSKPPFLIFATNFSASLMSTFFCASSTIARISPIPRIRPAIRSASNGSKPSIFSETPTNLRGTPVIWRTESAAPPLESPSSLVNTTPVKGKVAWKAFAVLTASCPSMASTTKSVSIGFNA